MKRDPLLEAIAREVEAQDGAAEPGQGHLDASRDAEFEEALFKPLDSATSSRIESRVLELIGQQSPEKQSEPARVVQIRSKRRAAIAAVVAPLALAAGLILYLSASPGSSGLPGYQLEVRGGASALRGPAAADSSAPLVLAPGSQLEIVARPSTAISGDVGARAYFVQGDNVRPWVPTIDISKDGAVRATAGASGWSNLAPGSWELVLMIARPADLPADATQARHRLSSSEPGRVHVLRRTVEVTR